MKKILLLLLALIASVNVWAEDYITDVMVIGGSQSVVNNLKDTYTRQGWTVIDQDLNAGCGSGSDYIYLLYKSASSDNLDAGAFVTDFYLLQSSSGNVIPTFIDDGLNYSLVPCDGSDYFKDNKGDLNSHCGAGSAYIHLYFAKDDDKAYRSTAVTSITFNATAEGAVCQNDTTIACDLNYGAGGDYIYMHTNSTLKGFTPFMNTTGTECYINGYAGPKDKRTSVTIPLTIDGATVLGFSGMTFSGFTNLETMNFYNNTVIDWMPSMQNCSKFKHVNALYVDPHINSGNDMTPNSMTVIPGYGFSRTAIETISLPGVTEIRGHAFEECNHLSAVYLGSAVQIGDDAFANISSNCVVSYVGPLSDWNPNMYMYSPNLYVRDKTSSWYCGWCGGDTVTKHNNLYWTLENNHLKIDCANNSWETNPGAQLITTYNWDKTIVKLLTIEHVDTIAAYKFQEYTSLETLQINSGVRIIGQLGFNGCTKLNTVYLPSSVTKIANGAFRNCGSLHNLYFDGTDEQWNHDMTRAENWNDYVADDFQAHWHCTVTFDANGQGTAPDPQNIEWSNQDKATEPTAPTAEGYNFTGWYTDAACTNQWDFNTVVPGDMTLYAGWEPVVVSKPGDANEDSKVDVNDVTTVINHILNKNPNPFNYNNANVNGDDKVDVLDVTLIINIILGLQ